MFNTGAFTERRIKCITMGLLCITMVILSSKKNRKEGSLS